VIKKKKGSEIKNKQNTQTKGENVMKKMNNKGFSLVELIVVVLIMAIIAVALAPQVMKWVENSRKSTDIENYNALVEACNVASTNEDFLQDIGSTVVTVKMTEGASGSTSITQDTTNNKLAGILNSTLPGWNNTKITGAWANEAITTETVSNGSVTAGSGTYNSTNGFQVSITKSTNGIIVAKVYAPKKNFS
jgi:prepilin-type N-terminal cleavage/methylation domain-containing protein